MKLTYWTQPYPTSSQHAAVIRYALRTGIDIEPAPKAPKLKAEKKHEKPMEDRSSIARGALVPPDGFLADPQYLALALAAD